jgi:hypothetical protein
MFSEMSVSTRLQGVTEYVSLNIRCPENLTSDMCKVFNMVLPSRDLTLFIENLHRNPFKPHSFEGEICGRADRQSPHYVHIYVLSEKEICIYVHNTFVATLLRTNAGLIWIAT